MDQITKTKQKLATSESGRVGNYVLQESIVVLISKPMPQNKHS